MGYRLPFRDWLALDTKPDVEGGTDKHFIATAFMHILQRFYERLLRF